MEEKSLIGNCFTGSEDGTKKTKKVPPFEPFEGFDSRFISALVCFSCYLITAASEHCCFPCVRRGWSSSNGTA